jgi:branched-chain amino acid transport system permease protein
VDLFLQLTTTGVLTGLIFGLLGLSWLIIYETTGVFHFAHGLSYQAAAYGGVLFTLYVTPSLPLAIVAGTVVATLVGVGCEVLVYARLRRRRAITVTLFLSAVGILTAGTALMQMILGPAARRLHLPDLGSLIVGPVAASWGLVLSGVGCGLLTVGVVSFLKFTRIGKEIRATAANLDLAELVGIRTSRIQIGAFALGSACLGVPAVFAASYDAATPGIGLRAVLFAFLAIFLGGQDSLWGPALGGMVVGLAAQLSSLWLPTYWQTTVAFTLFILVLIVKPTGLLGRGNKARGRIWSIGSTSPT